jgi:two-component system, NarL family, nitrate/nitrite response regulator NarL
VSPETMPMKVNKTLLIDDSDIDLFIQRRFLEVYNFSRQLVSYKSATDALNWLKSINGQEPPEVIFLDLNMPEVDGFEFLKSFKTLPEKITNTTKIVVLTSSNSSTDRDQAFENKNVIQFITKPLKQSDIELLNELMK